MGSRRGYLDWLRGVAVLIMIEAHTLDAWTRVTDRQSRAFGWAMILGGFGAPLFLFLAGISLALAARARSVRGLSEKEMAAKAYRRALWILALAFAFRLQAWLISGGVPRLTLLKVDILNVMGVSMLVAAMLWRIGRFPVLRALILSTTALLVAMTTPLVRTTAWLAPLPDAIEWYLRPDPGRGTFTLFPWAGFLFGGAAIGVWLSEVRVADQESRALGKLTLIGLGLAACSYVASYLPPLYPVTNFWTSSPTFFFLRLGILIAALGAAHGWSRAWHAWSPLEEFGRSSLFVYWIHVEMVYGRPSAAIHRQLPFRDAVFAFAAFALFLFVLAKLFLTIRRHLAAHRITPVGVNA